MDPIPDPNPNFGKITLIQKLYAAGVIFYLLPSTIVSILLRRIIRRSTLNLKDQITRALTRNALTNLPLSVLRQPGQAKVDEILGSPRFSSVRGNLITPVRTADFSGYWICENSITQRDDPRKSDVVILFAHGGGYVLGHISMWLSFLLRIAEIILSQGFTVSILALDYSLAPEHPFPKQLEQASAAYSYLIHDLDVNPEKIALMGDSAGGNLVLSLLTSFQTPLSSVTNNLPKPSLGAFLISPWVSFTHSSISFKENYEVDNLTKLALDTWASYFRSKSRKHATTIEYYTEFSRSVPGRPSLFQILPATVWVSAGGDELFKTDIESFASLARDAGVQINLNIKTGMPHDWQLMDASQGESAYLRDKSSTSPDKHLLGAVKLGSAIAEAVRVSKPTTTKL